MIVGKELSQNETALFFETPQLPSSFFDQAKSVVLCNVTPELAPRTPKLVTRTPKLALRDPEPVPRTPELVTRDLSQCLFLVLNILYYEHMFNTFCIFAENLMGLILNW